MASRAGLFDMEFEKKAIFDPEINNKGIFDPDFSMTAVVVGGGRTTKNTRAFPLGVEVGMNWRGSL